MEAGFPVLCWWDWIDFVHLKLFYPASQGERRVLAELRRSVRKRKLLELSSSLTLPSVQAVQMDLCSGSLAELFTRWKHSTYILGNATLLPSVILIVTQDSCAQTRFLSQSPKLRSSNIYCLLSVCSWKAILRIV